LLQYQQRLCRQKLFKVSDTAQRPILAVMIGGELNALGVCSSLAVARLNQHRFGEVERGARNGLSDLIEPTAGHAD
jgi:hypothetical protein